MPTSFGLSSDLGKENQLGLLLLLLLLFGNQNRPVILIILVVCCARNSSRSTPRCHTEREPGVPCPAGVLGGIFNEVSKQFFF